MKKEKMERCVIKKHDLIDEGSRNISSIYKKLISGWRLIDAVPIEASSEVECVEFTFERVKL